MSEHRFNKLQLYAAQADKTMTQVVEELIDSLPQPQELGNFSNTHSRVNRSGQHRSEMFSSLPQNSSHAALRVRRGASFGLS